MEQNKKRYAHAGTHWRQISPTLFFGERELVIGGIVVDYVTIPLFFFVKTSRSQILSKFELEGRGRVYSFEPIETFDGQTLEFQMIKTL
jgi:hypothetical protein